MFFEIFLPIAGLYVNFLFILSIGLCGGLVSNTLNIGSGVIITPVLIMINVPPMVAFASQLNTTIGTNLVGFWNHWRHSNVDFGLAFYLFLGGLGGALCEMIAYRYLIDGPYIPHNLNMAYLIILLSVGILFLFFNIKLLILKNKKKSTFTMKHWMIYLPFHRIFMRARVEMSILVPLVMGFSTGLLTTFLGGGISIAVIPCVAYLIGRVSPVVDGTARLAAFSLSIVISLIHAWHHAVSDWVLIGMLLVGNMIGSHIGRRISRNILRPYLGIGGAVVLIGLSLQFWYSLYKDAPVFLPTPKLHFLTTASLYEILETAEGFQKTIVAFAFYNPLKYTLLTIVGIIGLSFLVDRALFSAKKRSY